MPRLIHLNGAPGVGKSTLARRYADEHPGVLLCDVDVLRTMIGGWDADEGAAGRIRTTALAMITAYLETGHDVVLPQTVGNLEQLQRFTAAARAAGGEHVHVLLAADPDELVRRFRDRATAATDNAWTAYASRWVDDRGGDDALRAWVLLLDALDGIRVPSTDLATTYDALLVGLGEVV